MQTKQMQTKNSICYFIISVLTLSLAIGCATANPLKRPGQFAFKKWDGELSGEYNPKAFTSSEVKAQIAKACNCSDVRDYAETVQDNGLISFTATCFSSKFGESAAYRVDRTPFGVSLTELGID